MNKCWICDTIESVNPFYNDWYRTELIWQNIFWIFFLTFWRKPGPPINHFTLKLFFSRSIWSPQSPPDFLHTSAFRGFAGKQQRHKSIIWSVEKSFLPAKTVFSHRAKTAPSLFASHWRETAGGKKSKDFPCSLFLISRAVDQPLIRPLLLLLSADTYMLHRVHLFECQKRKLQLYVSFSISGTTY